MEGGDSEFANFTLPSLKAFLEACSHNVSGNKQYVVTRAIGCPKMHFFYELAIWSAKNNAKTLFFHPPSPFHGNFLTATVLAFVLLCHSRFSFHRYTQCEATLTQKLVRK